MYRIFVSVFIFIFIALAAPLDGLNNTRTSCGAPATQILQYSDDTFIENLFVLPNGNLLFTTFSSGDLLTVDPRSFRPTPKKVVSLPGSTGLTGIASLGNGLYAVTGGVHTGFGFQPGTLQLYVIYLATSTVLFNIPYKDTSTLNGIAVLPNRPSIVLSADSVGGRILRIDTLTRKTSVAFADPALASTNPSFPFGVNGLKIRGNYLYFSNSGEGTFGRVRIGSDGSKIGNIEIISTLPTPATGTFAYDDFAFDNKGNTYVALHSSWVNKITPSGSQSTFIGCAPCGVLKDPTSVALANDGKSIYISTGGTPGCSGISGGQILNVRL